jgi:MFS family permease
MNWQLFDAFGILLGFTANLAVSQVGPTAWRWQIASSVLPTIVLLSLIYTTPESPRFLMKRGHYKTAYQNLVLLRFHPILAAKELLYVHCQAEVEARFLAHNRRASMVNGVPPSGEEKRRRWPLNLRRHAGGPSINYWQKLYQLFTIKRNRRAIVAAVVCMISQQLCGVNVLQFFSSTFYCDARSNQVNSNGSTLTNQSYLQPLWLSWGIGLSNFIFAFPAYYFIDRKGRRWLLLVTIPLMALTTLAAGLSFLIPNTSSAHTPVIAFWTFLFMVFYSCGKLRCHTATEDRHANACTGMGPVPFTLSAEVFPLESRVVGMSFAVFTNLFGAGLLALFVPALTNAVGHPGLLAIFAGLNVVAFVLVFFFVRETAGAAVGGAEAGSMLSVSLEELNYIFGVSTAKHAVYQWRTVLPWAWRYYVRRDKHCDEQPEKLYTWARARDGEMLEVPKTV